MELQQIKRIGLQVAQAVFHPKRQVFAVVACNGLFGQAAAGLGGDHNLFLARFFQLRDETFAAPAAVNIGSVDEVDSRVNGFV